MKDVVYMFLKIEFAVFNEVWDVIWSCGFLNSIRNSTNFGEVDVFSCWSDPYVRIMPLPFPHRTVFFKGSSDKYLIDNKVCGLLLRE